MAKSWRLPFRYKKRGKEQGSFYTRNPAGKDINLRTRNADTALKRLAEAKKGKQVFEDDSGGAAAAVARAVVGTGDALPPPVVEPAASAASGLSTGASPGAPSVPPTHTAPPALPPITPSEPPESPAGASAGPASVHPDGYIPPPPGWADQVAAAAGASAPGGEGAEMPEIDEEFLDQVVGVCADVVVELQIGAQAWLIKRRAKIEPAPVPPEAKARELGRKLWVTALKKMFPDVPDIPEWLLAPIIIAALTVPTQIAEGKPIKPEAEPPVDSAGMNTEAPTPATM